MSTSNETVNLVKKNIVKGGYVKDILVNGQKGFNIWIYTFRKDRDCFRI